MSKLLFAILVLGIAYVNFSVPRTLIVTETLPTPAVTKAQDDDLDALAIEAQYKTLYGGVSPSQLLDENACIEGCQR